MELRQMATAFLSFEDHVLMMKKEKSRIFDFEFWGGIGGHLEYEELNSPMEASFREIEEETGFHRSDIENFRLKYILIGMRNRELQQQYVYFGETKHMNFNESDEGELFWIPKKELIALHTSTLIRAAVAHYLQNQSVGDIFVGAMAEDDLCAPQVKWSIIKNMNVFVFANLVLSHFLTV